MSFASGKRITKADRHVAKQLRVARDAAGLSREQVATKIGLSWQQIQNYESAASRITAGKLLELSNIYQKPVGSFFEGAPT